MDHLVRPCTPTDETSWLRCRVLAFLDTLNFRDVVAAHPVPDPDVADPADSIQWVAVATAGRDAGEVVAVLDASVGSGAEDGGLATIDTIAVHPDHRRAGLATRLLDAVVERLPERATVLDAWAREDPAAVAWYGARGFVPDHAYLQVHLESWVDGEDVAALIRAPSQLSTPVTGLFHASLEDEDWVRERFHTAVRVTRHVRPLRTAA
ncbi:hypothetical protein GY12_14725 [Micrococcus luteus]|nr:hypothetical protein GY12_14725 [Micrococcus luteus]